MQCPTSRKWIWIQRANVSALHHWLCKLWIMLPLVKDSSCNDNDTWSQFIRLASDIFFSLDRWCFQGWSKMGDFPSLFTIISLTCFQPGHIKKSEEWSPWIMTCTFILRSNIWLLLVCVCFNRNLYSSACRVKSVDRNMMPVTSIQPDACFLIHDAVACSCFGLQLHLHVMILKF